MADRRFRALSSCLVIAYLVVIVIAHKNVPEEGQWELLVYVMCCNIYKQACFSFVFLKFYNQRANTDKNCVTRTTVQ